MKSTLIVENNEYCQKLKTIKTETESACYFLILSFFWPEVFNDK